MIAITLARTSSDKLGHRAISMARSWSMTCGIVDKSVSAPLCAPPAGEICDFLLDFRGSSSPPSPIAVHIAVLITVQIISFRTAD
jgi:hypothetical protein